MLASRPVVSIVIPNHDHAADLERCIISILEKTIYLNYEILVVENNSKNEETFKLYKSYQYNPKVRVLNWNNPFNYSQINNWAVNQAEGDILLFLNNDTTIINKGWMEEMLHLVMRLDVGAVGAKLYYPDDTIQHAGIIIGVGGIAGHSHKCFPRQHPGYFGQLVHLTNVSAVTAACLMVRKKVFQEVGCFDENYELAFGDVDLCLKIFQKGYLNVWTPYAELYHYESKTRGYEDTIEKQKRFTREIELLLEKWNALIEKGDPYYNPNLTLHHEDFRFSTQLKTSHELVRIMKN
jgi:GT2 family glycosyltransferase